MSGSLPQRSGPPGPKIDFKSFSNIIAGKPAKSSQTFQGINPATKKKLWDVPNASRQDVDRAVKAAAAAQKEWAKKSWKERQEHTLRIKPVYAKHFNNLVELLMTENGKPNKWAQFEVGSMDFYVDFHAKLPIPTGETNEDNDRKITTTFHPLGVVAAICPWNFPLNMWYVMLCPR